MSHTIQKTFFSLLRSGLWETPIDIALFSSLSDADWKSIYHTAQSQSLLAIIFDAILTLPEELRPPRQLYLQWATQTARVEQANKHLNQILCEITKLYQDAGLHPVLLKGQGIGIYYRNPLHRQCGDIDVYFGKEGQKIANHILSEKGAQTVLEDTVKHTCYIFKDAHIEHHRKIQTLSNPFSNHRFSLWVNEWYPNGAESCHIMPIPPLTFNAIYIFLHAFKHFMNSGIGLRQLCDWACLFHKRYQEIDTSAFKRHLKELGLVRAAEAFGYVMVTYLGLPAEQFPLSLENAKERGEILLQEIFFTGNFGKCDTRVSTRPKGTWAGRWHTFRHAVSRSHKFRQFAPSEAFWYPYELITGRITMQLEKLRD